MKPASPIRAGRTRGTLQSGRSLHRRLPLKLYELESESGEDERVYVDLGLDQLEDQD